MLKMKCCKIHFPDLQCVHSVVSLRFAEVIECAVKHSQTQEYGSGAVRRHILEHLALQHFFVINLDLFCRLNCQRSGS